MPTMLSSVVDCWPPIDLREVKLSVKAIGLDRGFWIRALTQTSLFFAPLPFSNQPFLCVSFLGQRK